ncbi:hypothetical protein QZH41_003202 [Actinostola sp. cb2023]|nr:hypothetical protein QZH41_003202 [Actinostola sp. cb2023]
MFFEIVSKRGQESAIPAALRSIRCGYLAYQIESYQKSKNMYYDGSVTLKMTGNDCKLLERNCKKTCPSLLEGYRDLGKYKFPEAETTSLFFICRRRTPKEIRTDNGTNFCGAERELREAMQSWNVSHIEEDLKVNGVRFTYPTSLTSSTECQDLTSYESHGSTMTCVRIVAFTPLLPTHVI